MKLGVIGLGYVGVVTAAVFSDLGFEVIGVDLDQQITDLVGKGQSPISEDQTDSLLLNGVKRGLITATTDLSSVIAELDVLFVCVGTPSSNDGVLDLSAVRAVLAQVADSGVESLQIVIRSTMPPNSTDVLDRELRSNKSNVPRLIFNPEFLREGSAVADFYDAPYTICGGGDREGIQKLRKVYAKLNAPFIEVDCTSAEILKLANNSFHALKVVFANEIGAFAKACGADGRDVMNLVCSDTKLNISSRYLKPGFAFGGSCLPKDLSSITASAATQGLDLPLLRGTLAGNDAHLQRALRLVTSIGSQRIGFYGVAFKEGTDDLRESALLRLVDAVQEFAVVQVFDEIISKNARALDMLGKKYDRRSLRGSVLDSFEHLVDSVDTLIVGHSLSREYIDLLNSKPHKLEILDLTGGYHDGVTDQPMHSLCW